MNHYSSSTMRMRPSSLLYKCCSESGFGTFEDSTLCSRLERNLNMSAFGDETTNELNKKNFYRHLLSDFGVSINKTCTKAEGNSMCYRKVKGHESCTLGWTELCCQWVQLQLEPHINYTTTRSLLTSTTHLTAETFKEEWEEHRGGEERNRTKSLR